jgi:hypothetical protein
MTCSPNGSVRHPCLPAGLLRPFGYASGLLKNPVLTNWVFWFLCGFFFYENI